jgi:hypothetical protein
LESERIQGFPDNWTLPTDDNGDPDRIDSQRYHAVGNAVTVNVAEWLGHRIVAALAQSAGKVDGAIVVPSTQSKPVMVAEPELEYGDTDVLVKPQKKLGARPLALV